MTDSQSFQTRNEALAGKSHAAQQLILLVSCTQHLNTTYYDKMGRQAFGITDDIPEGNN